MANIKSAKKRIKVIEVKTKKNRRVKGHIKEILKGFETAMAEGDKETARNALAFAEKRLQQAASKGVIHKNAADRKVSRITSRFSQEFGKDALLEKASPPPIPEKGKAEAKKASAKPAPAPEKEEKPAKARSTKKESVEEAADAAKAPEIEGTSAEETVAEEAAVEETATEEAPAEKS